VPGRLLTASTGSAGSAVRRTVTGFL